MTVYKEPLEWVKKSIDSVANQTINEDLELVLVIDNPKYPFIEDIEHIVESNFDKNIIIVNQTNRGLVDSLNIAFLHATGDYIARMDSDDIALSDRFERELIFLKTNQLNFVASSIILISEEEHQISDLSFTGSLRDVYLKRVQSKQNQFWHPTWLMQKKVMEKLCGYRSISSVEDYDFVLRALLSNFRLGLLGDATVKKRFNRLSISEINNYKQSVYTQWLLEKYSSGEQADLKKLPVINKKRENQFYEIKRMLTNRKKLTMKYKVNLFRKLLFSIEGRRVIRSIFIQKYQIKVLILIRKIFKKYNVRSSDADY